MNYNLEKRTVLFSGNIIDFVKNLENNAINRPLINQIIYSK